jgi:hypothetical protein
MPGFAASMVATVAAREADSKSRWTVFNVKKEMKRECKMMACLKLPW